MVRGKDPQGHVERAMLAFIQARHDSGALSVTKDEVFAAVVPPNHPEFRFRPAYRYGLDRLRVRQVVNAVDDPLGVTHYFIGDYPTKELRHSLGLP